MREYHKHSDAVKQAIADMCEKGMTSTAMADITGLTIKQVLNIIKNEGTEWNSQKSIETIFNRRDLFPEMARDEERDRIYKKYSGKAMRWLILADIHTPFQHNKIIEQAMKEDVDGLIMSELMDFYGLSVFRKNKLISAVDELKYGMKLAKKLKVRFKNVIWFEANHERRLWKMLQDRLSGREDLIQVLDLDPPIMKKMQEIGIDATVSWWVKIGRLIVAHPDWYNQPPMRTVVGTQDHFLSKRTNIWKETDCIVNNHTHRMGMIDFRGQTLIESGCAAEDMDYTVNGTKASKNGETQRGYVIVKLDNDGSFNYNESRLVKYNGRD